MSRLFSPSIVVALMLVTGGCARGHDGGDYPSLARRPVERAGFAEPELPPPAPVTADAALDARIAAARSSAAELTTRFDREAAAAERAAGAARGRAVGSEAWLSAQSALAELDDARAALSALAAELDGAAGARAAALDPDYPALEAARTTIAGELDRQSAAIARLSALTPAS